MRNPHSAGADRQCATQATVAADIVRVAPFDLWTIPEGAILLLTALAGHHGRTYTHSLRVGCRAWQLSSLLDGDREQAELVFLAGLLHDIGKIDLPRSILEKPVPLTAAEWSMVRQYPDRGARLLQSHGELAPLIPIVASHQERPDGMGYPRRLLQPDIPGAALIIAVADATDSMGSHRPYAPPMEVEDIREELWAGAGTCWDYAAATAAAQALTQHHQPIRSFWSLMPPLNTPTLNLSTG